MSSYKKDFLVGVDPTTGDHTYPLGPLEGRAPGPYSAVSNYYLLFAWIPTFQGIEIVVEDIPAKITTDLG